MLAYSISLAMRLLIVSPIFVPLADSESFCGGKFTAALLSAGVDVTVICCRSMWPRHTVDTSPRWKSLASITVDVPNPPPPSLSTRCRLGLRYRTTEWTAWTAAVVAKAHQLHRMAPFDAVISRSYPWHAHMPAYSVASELGIPWVANLNDPWDLGAFITDPASRVGWELGWNARRWRHRVFARADILTFPCERLRDFSLRDSPGHRNVHVIPHVSAKSSSNVAPAGDFLVLHAGKLRTQEVTGRRPDAVVDGLRQFLQQRVGARARTRLMFVGGEDPLTREYVARQGLTDVVTWVGHVSYEASLEYIARAAVCLLVEADIKEGIFFPSKLCDYLAARKPVLALSPNEGTVRDLARHGGIIQVSPTDSKGVSDALALLFDAFRHGKLSDHAAPASLTRRYEAETVAEAFVRVIRGARAA
jgi:glycosyltransferase involved in cell wall biosynthesis